MDYHEDYKREVQDAFENAVRRLETERREPDNWEGRCLLDALAAIANGSFGLAADHIELCFAATRPSGSQPAITNVTLAGLRTSFDMVLRAMARRPNRG